MYVLQAAKAHTDGPVQYCHYITTITIEWVPLGGLSVPQSLSEIGDTPPLRPVYDVTHPESPFVTPVTEVHPVLPKVPLLLDLRTETHRSMNLVEYKRPDSSFAIPLPTGLRFTTDVPVSGQVSRDSRKWTCILH